MAYNQVDGGNCRMKKLLRAFVVLLLAACLLLAGAFGTSYIVYGRSLKASAYELVLRYRNRKHPTPEEESARLEAKLGEGEQPCVLPSYMAFRVPVAETGMNGMQVFTLNPGGGDVTVLYLHGGAYVNGFNAYQWRFMDRLARETGCEVIAPAYHLAPFGDCERGCLDIAGLFASLSEAYPDRRFVLMGDSAGAGLALASAEYLAGRGGPLPEQLILFSPWVDVTMENPDVQDLIRAEPMLDLDLMLLHGKIWAGDKDPHDWRVSPLFGEMAGLPPVTIYCGTRELLYPDILLAQEKLQAAGVDSTLHVGRGLNHDYPLMPIPEAEQAIREIEAQVRDGRQT